MFVSESRLALTESRHLVGREASRGQDSKETVDLTPEGGLMDSMPSWKRGLDLGLLLITAPLWVLLMLIIMVGIKMVSRGPVFFRQTRVGRGGREFECLKFRSMKCNASTQVHEEHLAELMKSGKPMVKLEATHDPRLIPFGDVLRATGLDELPQLFNVLRGDMSLVGPRPCTVYEAENYLPWQRQRFRAYPGITGLWQVNGKNKTTFDTMIRLDIEYANNLSFKMDVRILSRTLQVVLDQSKEAIGRRLGRFNLRPFTQNENYERVN